MSKCLVVTDLVAENTLNRSATVSPPARSSKRIAVLAVAALAALVVTGIATRNGIGILPNSVTYLMASKSLASQGTFEVLGRDGRLVPMTHFPPFYPILLSVAPAAGLDLLAWARCLNAVFFAATLILAGHLLHLLTRSLIETGLASGLLLLSVQSLYLYTSALSEPAFLFFVLLSAWLLARYLIYEHRVDLVLAASAAALAFMTRYAGAAFVAAGCLVLATAAARPIGRRLRDVFLFGALAGGPETLWIAMNRVQTGTAVNRPLAFHPLGAGHLAQAISTIGSWFVPDQSPFGLKVAVAVLAVGLFAVLWTRGRRTETTDEAPGTRDALRTVLGVWMLAYIALVLVTVYFVDAATQLSERILAPIFLLGLILGVGILGVRRSPSASDRSWRRAKRLGLAALLVSYLLQAWPWVGTARAEGLGYASVAWRSSVVMERIRALPPDTPIYTSGWEVVHFLTGREPVSLPWKVNKFSLAKEPNYEAEMAAMGAVLEQGGVLAFIRGLDREFLPTEDDLRSRFDLQVIAKDEHAVLLAAREGREPKRAADGPARSR